MARAKATPKATGRAIFSARLWVPPVLLAVRAPVTGLDGGGATFWETGAALPVGCRQQTGLIRAQTA